MISIYAPGESVLNVDRLESLGCGMLYDLESCPMFVDQVVNGPDGGRGRLAFVARNGSTTMPIMDVDASRQVWRKAARSDSLEPGRYWVGYWSNQPPRPEELQRPRMVDGQQVLLGGQHWVIPVADFFPRRLTIDPDTGREEKRPFEEHRPFIEEANRLFEHFLSDDFQKIVAEKHVVTIPDGLRFAADALAVNYRVNRDLVDALELIGEYEAFDVAKAATGLGLIVEEETQKKTAELAGVG